MLSVGEDRGLSNLKLKRNVEALVEEFNKAEGEVCAAVKMTKKDSVVVALCTPLMKRVHIHLDNCGEVCFLDTPNASFSTDCQPYFLISHSIAGGLPLGVAIINKVNEDTLFEAFELLKTILPVNAFGGRNLLGPKIVLTRRSQLEQNSLARAFPLVTTIVCCFHLIQSVWHSILLKNVRSDEHRARMMKLLKNMVHANSQAEMYQRMMDMVDDSVVSQYPSFKMYVINEVYGCREDWFDRWEKHVNLRSTYYKHILTHSRQVLGDKIMHRCRTYNIPRLFHFFMTRLDSYYRHRLEGIIHKKILMQSYKYMPIETLLDHDQSVKVCIISEIIMFDEYEILGGLIVYCKNVYNIH